MSGIPPFAAACAQPFSRVASPTGRQSSRVLAVLLASLLVGVSAAVFVLASSSLNGHSLSTPTSAPTDRVAVEWPFSRDSIWNLPIGAAAVYVPASITPASARWGLLPDSNVLVLEPNAPMTPVYYNSDAWSGRSRCDPQGGVLFQAPIPADFIIPGARPGWTPNYATAILLADGHTLVQGQPSARCTANGPATMWWYQTREDLFGTGISGAHGGSMLSSIGGTIRLGELVPGGVIRHAVKVDLFGMENLYYDSVTRGFRWPASTADGTAATRYQGTNPALRMGSLLALPSSVSVGGMGLETEPGRILAAAFQDYGGYVVDNAGWSVYNVATEFSPNGAVEDEFAQVWGFPISSSSRDTPWARDVDRIFLNLHVVENWNQAVWQTVAASNGSLGVGLGTPRAPWAPELGADAIAPQASHTLSGTLGANDWYRSPVTIALTATDAGSGVAAIHYRIDGGAWQMYSAPVTVSADGSHTVDYYARDVAGNQGAVQTVTVRIDTVSPTSTGTLSGTLGADDWYRSPVTVSLTATDGGSGVAAFRVRLDGSAWQAYTAPLSVSSDGPHTVDYYATDVAGNVEPIRTLAFRIDMTPPAATHTLTGTLGTAGWYVSPVTVAMTVTNGNGSTASLEYSLDGRSWVRYEAPFSVSEGRHVLEYRAVEGNNVSAVESVAFDVDTTAPTIFQPDPSGTAIPLDGTFSWRGSDSVSGIARYEVSIDGGPFQGVGLEESVTRTWSPGHHVAVVKAVDAAGNEATAALAFYADPSAESEPVIFQAGLLKAMLLAGMGAGLIGLGLAWRAGARLPKSRTKDSPHGSTKIIRRPGSRPLRTRTSPVSESSDDLGL